MSFFCLSNILTIILSNNKNSNVFFEDEIDLKEYLINNSDFTKYLLISFLCQINSNEFICYCINPKDGL